MDENTQNTSASGAHGRHAAPAHSGNTKAGGGSKRISLIIPAYNAERTIKRCLDSVLKQDEKPFEIIVVNDCSTDNTDCILSDYSEKESMVKILKNEINSGVSASRNLGLRYAQGDYVMFMDSDDYLMPDAISYLQKCISDSKADVIVSGINHLFADESSQQLLPDDRVLGLHHAPLLPLQLGAPLYTHNHLFSRDMPYGSFDTKKRLLEDREFIASLYKKAQSVFISNKITYCYVDSPNSAVHNVSFNDAFSAIKVDYDIFNYELQKGFPNPGFSILIDRIYASFKHAHTDDEQRMCLDYLGKITIRKCFRKGTSLRTYLKYLLLKIKYLFLSFKS